MPAHGRVLTATSRAPWSAVLHMAALCTDLFMCSFGVERDPDGSVFGIASLAPLTDTSLSIHMRERWAAPTALSLTHLQASGA